LLNSQSSPLEGLPAVVGNAMTIQKINVIQENINKLILPENEKHKN
jgi:hypothetical protein